MSRRLPDAKLPSLRALAERCRYDTEFDAGLSAQGWHTAGAAALMALLWITEALPIPVTALLPLLLFPALGLGDVREAAAPFANPIIYLFFGGFVIALAMQRWHLHRRLAISLIAAMGTRPRRIVLGFLVSSAIISMWVSNTATAMMILPIATSVLTLLPREADARSVVSLLALDAGPGAVLRIAGWGDDAVAAVRPVDLLKNSRCGATVFHQAGGEECDHVKGAPEDVRFAGCKGIAGDNRVIDQLEIDLEAVFLEENAFFIRFEAVVGGDDRQPAKPDVDRKNDHLVRFIPFVG